MIAIPGMWEGTETTGENFLRAGQWQAADQHLIQVKKESRGPPAAQESQQKDPG
jgi:hypothetical protein